MHGNAVAMNMAKAARAVNMARAAKAKAANEKMMAISSATVVSNGAIIRIAVPTLPISHIPNGLLQATTSGNNNSMMATLSPRPKAKAWGRANSERSPRAGVSFPRPGALTQFKMKNIFLEVK